jgi:hypothetical protein
VRLYTAFDGDEPMLTINATCVQEARKLTQSLIGGKMPSGGNGQQAAAFSSALIRSDFSAGFLRAHLSCKIRSELVRKSTRFRA